MKRNVLRRRPWLKGSRLRRFRELRRLWAKLEEDGRLRKTQKKRKVPQRLGRENPGGSAGRLKTNPYQPRRKSNHLLKLLLNLSRRKPIRNLRSFPR